MTNKPLTRKVKDHRGNDHEVYKWFWMKGWQFYQTEPADEFGVVMGFMTNCPCPEWGSQHEAELYDVSNVVAEKYDLWELAPPEGWEWLEKENCNVA